ncbi:MAG TPA: hypothetical protein VGQ53_21045 [Chitinophagaceae bacterium]|nr:hypothetical protein [Chitinophagaceae bacterium]
MFESFGQVSSVKVINDHETGRSPGVWIYTNDI